MKKFALIIFVILLHVISNAQQSSLSDFLNRDLTQILQAHIDSLNNEVRSGQEALRRKNISSMFLNEAASSSINFFLLLGKIENNLPLNEADSIMINFSAQDTLGTIQIIVNPDALQMITDKDSLYINNFPKLAKMIKENKLIIERAPHKSLMTAPEIEIPPAPALTGNNKQLIEQAWLSYLYELSNKCKDAQAQLDSYFKKEKTKIPDGNVDKIIKLRQKFAVFIIENYCKNE